MLDIKIFKNQIDVLWEDEKYKSLPFVSRGYAIQSVIPFNSILFIGINPSFNEKKNKHFKSFFYDVHKDDSHKYFKKFKDIGEKTKNLWSHFDLLFLRETNQNNIKHLYNSLIGKEFLDEQLLISKKVIESSKPKIIVISNAFARDLFLKDGIFQTEFDSQIGTHKIINNEKLVGVPVFFTSMLTGQRALDNGSYERLIWHLKKILN
ncbi:MAG: hypothetical protein KGZ81_00790 [Flavobacteriales bacterium]|nr:hypothetical protein [Flavobacteriales bacterium]